MQTRKEGMKGGRKEEREKPKNSATSDSNY